MENFNFINYHRSRDFSRKMNATFEFIRQNFKPLLKSIIFIAGPPVLIASLLMATFMDDLMSFSRSSMTGSNPEMALNYFMSISFWVQMMLLAISLVVAGVMTLSAVNNYMLLYEEKRTNKIEVHDVWNRVRDTFGMYLSTTILFTVLYIAVIIVMMIPFALFAAISPVLVFFGVFIFIGLLFYIVISISLTFFVRAYERIGFFESLARSFKLVQGKWWSTFGLIVILYIVASFASMIFYIPGYILTMINMLHSLESGAVAEPSSTMQLITVILMTFYYLVSMVMNALPNIGIAFQYFNLVELKEAKGLLTSIESFGQEQQPPVAQQQDEHY